MSYVLSDNIASVSVASRDLCVFNNSDFYHTQQHSQPEQTVSGREIDRERERKSEREGGRELTLWTRATPLKKVNMKKPKKIKE